MGNEEKRTARACAYSSAKQDQNGTQETAHEWAHNIYYPETFTIFCGTDWPGVKTNGDNNNEPMDCDRMITCLNSCVAWDYNTAPSGYAPCVGVTWVPNYTAPS